LYRLTDGIDFMKSLPDNSVDGIFTDPPWSPPRSNRRKYQTYAGKGRPRTKVQIKGAENWLELIVEMTEEAARILKSNGRCLIWLGAIHIGPVCKAVDALEYRWCLTCRYMPPRYVGNLQSFTDFILVYLPFGSSLPSRINGKSKPQEYYHASKGRPDTAHPCARPYETVLDILRHWFDRNEYVIDPFAGSDTVGVACRKLDLKWDSCEVDPEMYKTGKARHSQGLLFEDSNGGE